MAKVSVIIPNYNGYRFLKDCLESLAGQKEAPSFEIIFVDNGSTDESIPYVKEQFPQVRIIELSENTGFCYAVNRGIEASESEYVLLLNNDTKCDSYFIKHLYECMEREGEKVFSVSAKMLCYQDEALLDGAGDRYCVLGWSFARGKLKPEKDYDKTVTIFSACGGAAIYRKAVLDKIGLFDERHFAYLEDLDLGYRAKILGYRNLYEPKARVIHYGSATSGSRYNEWKTKLSAENNVYVAFKNMPLLQWIFNLPFLCLGTLVKQLFFCKKGLGRAYLFGVGRGLKKSFSREGFRKKVPFRITNSGHYFRIQMELFANVFRILMKS